MSVNDPLDWRTQEGYDLESRPYRFRSREENDLLEAHVFDVSEGPDEVPCPRTVGHVLKDSGEGIYYRDAVPCGGRAVEDRNMRGEPGPRPHLEYRQYRCTSCGRYWPVLCRRRQ